MERNAAPIIGRIVKVTVDRPMGTRHPEHEALMYPINYGFVEGIPAPDGEAQDAYILGVDGPVREFTGKVIAVIKRNDDVETKWVVAPENRRYSREEVLAQIHFQERYFAVEVSMED